MNAIKTEMINNPKTGAYGKEFYSENIGNLEALNSSMKKLLDE